MADYYSQLSSTINIPSKAARDYLEELIEGDSCMTCWQKYDISCDGDRRVDKRNLKSCKHHAFTRPDYSFSEEKSDGSYMFWFGSESCDLDGLITVFQKYLKKYNPKGYIAFSTAETCSKLRPDEIGGTALFITAKKVASMSTFLWVDQQIKRHNKRLRLCPIEQSSES